MAFMNPTVSAWLLDAVLLLFIVSQVVHGWRRGLVPTVLWLAGMVTGGIAAVFAIPLVNSWLPASRPRLFGVVLTGVALVALGGAIGTAIGRGLSSALQRLRLGVVNRTLGAGTGFVFSTAVILIIGSSLSALGSPLLTSALSSSRVLGTIETAVPAQWQASLRAMTSSTFSDAGDWLVEALGDIDSVPETAEVDLGTPELTQAAESVVRITGTAYRCGQSQSGSGVVVAHDRILTNAHVVAGVSAPVVEAPGQAALTGRVVYYDADTDLALIAVEGLDTASLSLADGLSVGDAGAVMGYPYGGPFQSHSATVMSTSPVTFSNESGRTRSDVATIASDVQSGNSGGPLLNQAGQIAGIVFAKEASIDGVGYVLTLDSVRPVVQQAATMSAAVSPGTCTVG